MEQEKLEEFEGIGEYMFNASKSELFVDLRKEALDAGLAIQELVAEVRRLQTEPVDIVSTLEVGDTVVSLIDYMECKRGTVGTVDCIRNSEEYPIEVRFEETKFLYLHNGVLGFNRNELGKVSK